MKGEWQWQLLVVCGPRGRNWSEEDMAGEAASEPEGAPWIWGDRPCARWPEVSPTLEMLMDHGGLC